MFGQNPIRKADSGVGDVLDVVETFPTIQGEGPRAGQPAHFIRLAHCNLACTFCDTQFEVGAHWMSVDSLLAAIQKHDIRSDLVVITGGEPLRQNIGPLIDMFHSQGFTIQIETAGTLMPFSVLQQIEKGRVELVCSPKTKNVHPIIGIHCQHFKYIIRNEEIDPDDGLPTMSTQLAGVPSRIYRPGSDKTIWLQPCEEYGVNAAARTKANTDLAARLAMKYGYRLSLQLHKIVGLP